jgi:hypothetical protein
MELRCLYHWLFKLQIRQVLNLVSLSLSLFFLLRTEAEFLDEIQTKVLKVFLLAIQSDLYSFALKFLFLQTHATSYSLYIALLYTLKEKGENLLENHPPSLWFKKSLQNPQV